MFRTKIRKIHSNTKSAVTPLLCCCVCPPEPLHHSARHLSKLFAPGTPTLLLCLLSSPQASNQKEATRKSWGWPQLQIQCHFQHKSTTTISYLKFTSEYTLNMPIDINNITLWKRGENLCLQNVWQYCCTNLMWHFQPKKTQYPVLQRIIA